MQHNFVKCGDNWIKFGNLSYIWTHNRCAKFQLKIPSRLAKIDKSGRGGNFFDSHCILSFVISDKIKCHKRQFNFDLNAICVWAAENVQHGFTVISYKLYVFYT